MVDDVGCFDRARSECLISTRVQVSIKSREVAAGNLEPQFVTYLKDIVCRPKIHADVIDIPGICKFRFLLRVAVAQAEHAIRVVAILISG